MSNSATGGGTAAWGIATATSPGMLSTVEQDVAGVKHFIDGAQGPGTVPIGCMVTAMPNIDAVNAWQPPVSGVIKDGFMRADGTVINAGHISQGCLLALNTVLPSMMAKYPRGGTTSGATGGSNLFTPAGTNATSNVPASGLTFSGSGVSPSSTFAASGSFTDSVSVPSTSYSVSNPAHYHGMGTNATFAISNASGGHNHTVTNASVPNHDHTHLYTGVGSQTFVPGSGLGYTDGGAVLAAGRTFTTQTPSAYKDISVSSTDGTHGHTTASMSGTIGFAGTGGVDGNIAQTASITGTATGTGTATARSTWFTSTTYTPSGSITGAATAAAQVFTGTQGNNEPAYIEVVWVIRVK